MNPLNPSYLVSSFPVSIYSELVVLDANSRQKRTNFHIIEENTGVVCIGDRPIHMTSIEISDNQISIKGHSIMMGYTDKRSNSKIFNNNSMIIKNNLK